MSKLSKIFDAASGYLFMAGSFASKLTVFSVFLSAISSIISLIAYLLGYLAWYIAALYYPNTPKKPEWFGFAPLKEQYQLTAVLGLIATILCIYTPVLLPFAAWMYALSNIMWCITEYHKQENPPLNEEGFSSIRQRLYFRYTLLVTISSAAIAITATISLFFPPLAFALFVGSTIFTVGLAVISLYYWGQCTFSSFSPDRSEHSYTILSNELEFNLVPAQLESSNEPAAHDLTTGSSDRLPMLDPVVKPREVESFLFKHTTAIPEQHLCDTDALPDNEENSKDLSLRPG